MVSGRRRSRLQNTKCQRSRFFVPALGGRQRRARHIASLDRPSALGAVVSRCCCTPAGLLWSRHRLVLAGGHGCDWCETCARG